MSRSPHPSLPPFRPVRTRVPGADVVVRVHVAHVAVVDERDSLMATPCKKKKFDNQLGNCPQVFARGDKRQIDEDAPSANNCGSFFIYLFIFVLATLFTVELPGCFHAGNGRFAGFNSTDLLRFSRWCRKKNIVRGNYFAVWDCCELRFLFSIT